ncbi:hypothetical protein J4E93_005457 [Alternaria ventricosa]|uniref:uncharacterized protein n=1 Tax=Alternaria ventricosa TaxID=1187951 RepID=UPI0020C1C2DC|nr:uncharacterized protein J4E93_005457 [Alternaria ventricosa]KAI4645879.1 hypothetical protein J4E93_005457 [Alternaria ventricosa]
MVFTPRKRAAPTATFDNTWNETNAAFLDPNALQVSKIPRGWERKQEVKRVGEGKEKKIWRRFNLRSRADDTPQEAEDEEERDARSRPVKRRQHMSPKAMEKSTSKLGGKKRAFKATRWDRRKSVLPRKRATQTEDPAIGANDEVDSEEEGDSAQTLEREDSINETDTNIIEQTELSEDLSSTYEDSSTFTFAVDAPTAETLDYEITDRDQEEERAESTQDATLAKLFRSPLKEQSNDLSATPEKVEYPELPLSDNLEVGAETAMTEIVSTESISDVAEEITTAEMTSVGGEPQEDVEIQAEVVSQQDEPTREDTEPMSETPETVTELQYPALPLEDTTTSPPPTLDEDVSDEDEEDVELSEVELGTSTDAVRKEDVLNSPEAADREDEFTEASLQLNILRDYQAALQEHNLAPTPVQSESNELEQEETDHDMRPEQEPASFEALQSPAQDFAMADAPHSASIDIADGLTFSFTPSKPQSPTPRRLHSPPPPPRPESGPDDVTMTVAIDDDTAILKDFLTRAAASKAEKAAVTTHKRESLQNRRDSDIIKHALASPRKVLEEKDPNSPTKPHTELTLDLSQTLTLAKPDEKLPSPIPGATVAETAEEKSEQGSRRSARAKKTRLPTPASIGPAPAPKINIRRADGNEVVVLKKDDAKVLADMTRNNTRKNKQGAFCVTVRLMKLAMDYSTLPPLDDSTKELIVGKNVRWDETLAYYQENPETLANALADAESLATPDELGMSDCTPEPKKKKEKTSKNSTPKIRRVRGLGTANGTPGKGLLAPSSLLPEAVQEEKAATQEKQSSKPKSTKVKKMAVASNSSSSTPIATLTPTSTSTSLNSSLSSSTTDTKLPSLDVAPVGVQRKSRLAAPKKVVLPQTPSSAKAGDKENVSRVGMGDATPKKGLMAPKVVIPPSATTAGVGMGVESGLPRRRGRKY